MSPQNVLLAVRHKTIVGDFTGDQGLRLLIAWTAIVNRHAAQVAYEQHLRVQALDALHAVGYSTPHYGLEDIAADILSVLDLVSAPA